MDIALPISEIPKPSRDGSLVNQVRRESPGATRVGDIDIETLYAAQNGEKAAIERFIRHYQIPVFAFISRSTGCGAHVEDLAQEVFLRVCRALPAFVLGRARISTWIFQIAVRLIQDARKRYTPHLVSVSDELGDSKNNPEERCAHRRTLNRIEELVARLPEEQRMTLVLVEFHGASQKEVAEITTCALSTVKTRLHRARNFLREEIMRTERDCYE